jgi:hypothetical protein
VFDHKFYVVFFFLTILIELSLISQDLSQNAIVIYGEKMDKKKSNNDNVKVYNDYLIRDPSEYGTRDTYTNPTHYDNAVNVGDRALKIHSHK